MPSGKGQSRGRASGPCVLSAGGSENSSPSLLVRSSLQMRQLSWRGRQDRPPNILLILFVMRPTPLFRSKRCNINYEACSTSYTWLPSMYIFSYYIFLTFNKQSEQFCPNPSYPYLCTGQLNYYAVVNERNALIAPLIHVVSRTTNITLHQWTRQQRGCPQDPNQG